MKKHKEYMIRGDYGDYGETYSHKHALKKDLKWAKKRFPNDNFKIYSRKVSDWKEVR